ncbi:hypothetical protein QCA50_013303 [Cerrena zonata]|uniref:C2H2-type domain-containing protein n=1 Tax=Cerrena zonata TaxID=2478898 RepID=A0AAW0FZ74_9APHY
MEEINLNEYFEGIPADRTCPSESCPHISETDIEFRDHLWTHKEAEAGRPISNKERLNKCPHPDCQNATFNSSIIRHMNTHTGGRSHMCPHLVSWEPNERELCWHSTSRYATLMGHRKSHHGYDPRHLTATDPWVEPADIALSNAKLCFSKDVAKAEAVDGDNDNVPQNHADPPPVVNAPGNAPAAGHQIPQPQLQVPLPNAPPAGGHYAPGAHQQGAAFAGMNHGPQGPFPGAAHAHGQPHAVPGGPLHLRRVEVTRISHIPHPLGHIVTEIEKRTYA